MEPITIDFRATVGNLQSGIKQAQQSIRGLASETEAAVGKIEASTEKISHLFRAAFEAFIGFEAIDGLKKIALGAAEAADQLDVAARVARNFHNALDPAAMEKWLEAFANSAEGGGYAVDQLRGALAEFTALGLNASQTQRAIADTAALAAARHMDFAEAANVVRMALTGHVEMLSRYGIVSREAAKNIHTVEEAMEAIEKASSGAAEERAKGLLGIFGRMGSAFQKLGETFGKGLEPFFSVIAAGAAALANAMAAIPQPVMNVIATLVALATGLVAVTLMLPAIAKGIEIVKEGFGLLKILGSPLITLFQDLYVASAGGASGLINFAAGELAAIAPAAAVVAAVVAIIVAVREIVYHLDHVKTAWHDWTQYLSDSFAEFVDNFKRDHSVLMKLIGDIGLALQDPANAWKLAADWVTTAAPKTSIKEGPKLIGDTDKIGADIVRDWTATWKQIMAGVFGKGKGPAVPNTPFDGTTGTGSDGAQKAIDNALTSAKGMIDAAAAVAAQAVDRAKARLDATKAELEMFDAQHEGDKLSPEIAAQREQLIANELRDQMAVRDALAHQQEAEINAADRYAAIAKALPAGDKDRVAHTTELNKAADAHKTKALEIKAAWEQVAAEIAKAMKELIGVPIALATQQYSDAAKAIDEAHASNQSGIKTQISDVDFQEKLATGRNVDPAALNELKVRAAELAVALAQDTLAAIQEKIVKAQAIEDQKTRDTTLADLHNQLAGAETALNQATNNLTLSVIDANKAHTQWLSSLVSKVPGASMQYNQQGGFAGIAFNWQSILGQAIEKTQSFADIMQVVNIVMNLFAEIVDAFRPVIDALLEVVLGVAQVFVILWNAISNVLRLLGIHIENLKLENQLESTSPLLRIFHDLPTLQEANSTGPLTLTAIDQAYKDNITNPLTNMLQSPNLGGGLLVVLGEILGALVIIKTLMAAFGGGGSGGIGGLFGWIKGLFGGGGSSLVNPAGFDAAQAAEYGMPDVFDPSVLTDSVQQGVTNALSDSAVTGSDGYVSQAVSSGVQDAAQTTASSVSSAGSSLFSMANVGSAIGGALEGIQLGKTFSKMFGTDSPVWGEALGGAGGAAGGLLGASLLGPLLGHLGWLAGPIGGIAGALLGAVIGGMIGPHWGPASNYPDRSEPNYGTSWTYGQFVADYTGAPGSFNGQTIGPDSMFAGSNNMTAALEAFVKNANVKSLSGSMLQIYDELKQLGGASNNLGIKSEYNGMFTLDSGQQVSVQNLMQLVNSFFQDGLNGFGTSLASAAQNVKHASDALNELTNAVTLQGNAISRSQVASGSRSGSGGINGTPPVAPVTFQVTTGDVYGYNDVQQLGQDLALATIRGMPNRAYVLNGAPQT